MLVQLVQLGFCIFLHATWLASLACLAKRLSVSVFSASLEVTFFFVQTPGEHLGSSWPLAPSDARTSWRTSWRILFCAKTSDCVSKPKFPHHPNPFCLWYAWAATVLGAQKKVEVKLLTCGQKDQSAQKGRKVAKHYVVPMFCGSGRSKNRLAKAAGAGPSGGMGDQKSKRQKHLSLGALLEAQLREMYTPLRRESN